MLVRMADSEVIRGRLAAAAETGELVRFEREQLEPGPGDGYVVALGKEYFLIANIGNHIRFDGFQALRYEHVTELEVPSSRSGFLERALSLRGEQRPATPPLDLDSTEGL